MRGSLGLLVKEAMRSLGSIRDVTPGKWRSKNSGNESGVFGMLASSSRKYLAGMNSVHVNEPSYYSIR